MRLKKDSYKSFLQSIPKDSVSTIKESADDLVRHFQPKNSIAFQFTPVGFLVDFSTKHYLYVGESCFEVMGYTAKQMFEFGLENYLSKWHPSDFEVINKIVFPSNMAFLQTIPVEQFPEFIFSYNYRVQNPKGQYTTLLQRFSYVSGAVSTQPAGMIGVAFDITHYKNDISIVQTIEQCIYTNEGPLNKLMYKKIHPVFDEKNEFLTKQEASILRLISQGLPSKQIAEDMGLSVNTINNHRRNMLAKTGCRSSSELIRHAVKHGLL